MTLQRFMRGGEQNLRGRNTNRGQDPRARGRNPFPLNLTLQAKKRRGHAVGEFGGKNIRKVSISRLIRRKRGERTLERGFQTPQTNEQGGICDVGKKNPLLYGEWDRLPFTGSEKAFNRQPKERPAKRQTSRLSIKT